MSRRCNRRVPLAALIASGLLLAACGGGGGGGAGDTKTATGGKIDVNAYDPFRFDVTRTPNEHVAFGIGAHFCLGANLARLELRVLLEEALPRLAGLELASSDPPPLRASNFISGLESLPVVCR